MSKKRFHKSDSLIYQFNHINYPYDPADIIISRDSVMVHASSGVTWRDIVAEINEYSDNPDCVNYAVLKTCMVDYPDFIVAMTLRGALKIVEEMVSKDAKTTTNPISGAKLYLKKVDYFAKEVVAYRDYRRAIVDETYVPADLTRCNFLDFWPKD